MTHSQTQAIWWLNALNAADLVFWTEPQLWEYSSEAVLALCREHEVLPEVLADITVPPATSFVQMDMRCVRPLAVFHRSVDGGTEVIRQTRRATMADIEALGDTWQTDEGNFITDFAQWRGEDTLAVYPRMRTGRTVSLQVVGAVIPADVSGAAATTVDLPEALRPLVNLATVAAARAHEGPARMPEVAAQLQQAADLVAGVLGALWGN